MLDDIGDEYGLGHNRFFGRFKEKVGIVYILFFVLICLFMLFRLTVLRGIGKCTDKCGETDNAAEKRMELATFSVSEDFVAEIKFGPLYEYYKRSELEYRALQGFKEDELPGEHMDNELIRKVRGRMKKRVEVIKNRFDQYLELMIQEVGREEPGKIKVDKPLYFDGHNLKKLTIQSKYQLLQQNEHIVQASKTRQNKNVMRMKGITQSYYIYDSEVYKTTRKALREIINS